MKNFEVLYNDDDKSNYPRNIQVENGEVYRLDKKSNRYVLQKGETRFLVSFEVRGKNQLKTKEDVATYCQALRYINKNILRNNKFHYDYTKIERLIRKAAQVSFSDKIQIEDNTKLIQCIDEASAGGCLIAKAGKYDGDYSLYDINNSYNDFFVNYFNIPTKPTFKTVTNVKISNKYRFALYRLEMADKKYLDKEHTMKFKTNRKWFTSQDIEIFKMYGIEYNLINEENNCILYETAECDFNWMNKLNALKQRTDKTQNPILYNTCKQVLSSFWGQCSKYATVEFKQGVKADIPYEWYYKTGELSGDKIYINPEQIYKYSCGIIKPFVLSWARLRLLKQIKKVEDKGHKVIFAHTDSILCNTCDDLFELGSEIGDYKLEKRTEKGITINNIASKQFY